MTWYSLLKKNLIICLLSLGILPSLVSCNKEVEINDDVIFTELYNGSNAYDSVLEISVINDSLLNLDNYKLAIYNGSSLKFEYDLSSINLTSNIILFINKDCSYIANNEVISIKLDDNYVIGSYYFELTYMNKVADALGYKGINLFYVSNQSLVRLKEFYTHQETFNELNYIRVRSGITSYLGNDLAPLTLEEILEGPHLNNIYLEEDYEVNNLGGGGFLEVNSYSLGDGDTTYFHFNSPLIYSGRVRYLLIDTPEIDHGSGSYITAEPFGKEAKRFNNTRLINAKSIIVQSNKGYSLEDTYSRLLGYVWYSNVDNPSTSDYFLLNHQLVVAGLAKFSTYNKYETMYYKDVLYYDYLDYGAKRAKSLGIKIYGEIDPEFDYS